MWKCSTCDEQVEDDLDVCWNCQTGKDGSSSEVYFRKELVPRELQTMHERISQQTDSDLLRVASLDPNEYRQDGIDLARAELERRGVIPRTYGSGSGLSIGRVEPTKVQQSDGDHRGLRAIQSGDAKERAAMKERMLTILNIPKAKGLEGFTESIVDFQPTSDRGV